MDRSTQDPAFAALYRNTFPKVWGILRRVGVKREDERREVAQDVYVVVHQKRGDRDPAIPEAAWVCSIARNTGLRYVALRRTREEQPMDVPGPPWRTDAAAPGATPEDVASRRQRYLALMESLDPDRWVVFEMHVVEGHELPEIARILGKPLGTIKKRLARARSEVDAAVARMKAGEARVEGSAIAPFLVPLGLGSWSELGHLFDEVPPGVEDQVWQGVHRGLARASAIGAGLASGSALAGKLAIGGAGAALGGVATAALLYALGLVSPRPPSPPPLISRAPDVATLTTLPAESAPPVPRSPADVGGAAPATTATAAALASAAPRGAAGPIGVRGIDPEEQRILEQANAAFGRGNFGGVRAALDDHARRFPPGRASLGAEADHLRAKLAAAMDGGTGSSLPTAKRPFGVED